MNNLLIKNAKIVNEGKIFLGDLLIKNDIIEKIDSCISVKNALIIDARENYLIPGVIDDQVHFREPGLTHKAEIYTESKAAIAGGITSFMEMPNTIPNTLNQKLLEEKYQIASKRSIANYSFFMGVSNNNMEEVLKTNPKNVPGLKIFMGSSTGNMLVDNHKMLEKVFSRSNLMIATHCEDEDTIRANTKIYKKKYGDSIPIKFHPIIRDQNACFLSSSFAVDLAKQHNARLHVLHISTKKEINLFNNNLPLKDKKITAEACIHHLVFSDEDYEKKGALIKWNPAIKTKDDKEAIWEALLNNKIDVIATDHAPHTIQEKKNPYTSCPSGGPLVQHGLSAILEFVLKGKISIKKVVEKMCHNPAIIFQIKNRGFIKEGYKADLAIVDMNKPYKVNSNNILYKCKWSPFTGEVFQAKVTHTFVNGHLAYKNGIFNELKKGERILYNRV